MNLQLLWCMFLLRVYDETSDLCSDLEFCADHKYEKTKAILCKFASVQFTCQDLSRTFVAQRWNSISQKILTMGITPDLINSKINEKHSFK